MATALVTGASAGLGQHFAELFAADKHDVVLVARRLDRLEALAAQLSASHGVRAEAIAADLMDPASPSAIVAEVERRGLVVEFLVNNAGFGLAGPFHENAAAKERGMIEVNVTALTMLTHALLPGMVQRKRGRILNVGSTAGFQPGPFMSTYYATKAYVNAWSQALSHELKGTGVTCTLSCPGATLTEFAAAAGNDRSRLFRMGAMRAEVVAAQAYRAMHRGTRMVVHGFTNKLSAMSAGVTPTALVLPVVASLNQDPEAQKRLTGGRGA
jgi:short-subunit dehydrogenase